MALLRVLILSGVLGAKLSWGAGVSVGPGIDLRSQSRRPTCPPTADAGLGRMDRSSEPTVRRGRSGVLSPYGARDMVDGVPDSGHPEGQGPVGRHAAASGVCACRAPRHGEPRWGWGCRRFAGRGECPPAGGCHRRGTSRSLLGWRSRSPSRMSMRALSTATEHALYNTFREVCVGSQY
jgi:hypothetical protein